MGSEEVECDKGMRDQGEEGSVFVGRHLTEVETMIGRHRKTVYPVQVGHCTNGNGDGHNTEHDKPAEGEKVINHMDDRQPAATRMYCRVS